MNSGEPLSPAMLRVLRHIARYRLSFTEIIEHICLDGQSSRKTMESLTGEKRPLVEKVGGFAGRRNAFKLTQLGSKLIAGNAERNKAPNPANLSLLAFCCLSGKRRIRLEQAEIQKYFGKPLPGRHLVLQASGNYCLHSVYSPGASTKDQTVLAKIIERFQELAETVESTWNPDSTAWLNSGKLRVTAIVETKEKAERISAALKRRLDSFDHPAMHYSTVASANTDQLEELLRGLR